MVTSDVLKAAEVVFLKLDDDIFNAVCHTAEFETLSTSKCDLKGPEYLSD